jgi:putative serine protease PepD
MNQADERAVMTSTTDKSHRQIQWKLVAAFASVAIVAAVIGGVVTNAFISSSTAAPLSSATGTSCSVAKVASQALPSVVTISAKGKSGGGTGSGSIIRSDGYILTNNHVIAIAANGGSISVLFNNGKTAAATLVGRDPLTDVAVVKVDNQGKLPAISIGSSSNLLVGQSVIALGAPLGLSSTVTSGIVSALDRTIDVPGEDTQSALLIDAIQTDAAINPGNSGGALVNCAAQLVGMPSAGATVPTRSGEPSPGNIGLGFAIPVNLAIDEANEIISTGHVTHSYFGLTAEPLSVNADKVKGVAEGLFVTAIDPNGPAQAAGLRAGDIINDINGQPAYDTGQLVQVTLSQKPGTTVKLGYNRNGKASTATLTLASQPS